MYIYIYIYIYTHIYGSACLWWPGSVPQPKQKDLYGIKYWQFLMHEKLPIFFHVTNVVKFMLIANTCPPCYYRRYQKVEYNGTSSGTSWF